MRSCISSANMRANSGPISVEQDCNGDNGAVLKQLLLTGNYCSIVEKFTSSLMKQNLEFIS